MPPKKALATKQISDKISNLKSLANQPEEQAQYALQLLEKERNVLLVEAALNVLEQNPTSTTAMRPVLMALYDYYSADGPKRDAGATLRATIIQFLYAVVSYSDIALLEKAATTIEFMPPGHFDEIAAPLRASSVVTMSQVDATLTSYHCVRLLTDKYTSKMSGEPAATAARVLAAQGNSLPLYQYLTQAGEQVPEVMATCLRGLTAMPISLLADLVERYKQPKEDTVLVGLFDLLLKHPNGAAFQDFLIVFLSTTSNYDLYRYLALAIFTTTSSTHKILLDSLLQIAADEKDPRKLIILIEVLELSNRNDKRLKTLLTKLKASNF
jgi:hypothetical protein